MSHTAIQKCADIIISNLEYLKPIIKNENTSFLRMHINVTNTVFRKTLRLDLQGIPDARVMLFLKYYGKKDFYTEGMEVTEYFMKNAVPNIIETLEALVDKVSKKEPSLCLISSTSTKSEESPPIMTFGEKLL